MGRDLWVHLAHPLLKQGHSEQIAQDHVQAASDYLQGANHKLSTAFVRAQSSLTKKCFLMLRWCLLHFLCPSSPDSCPHTWLLLSNAYAWVLCPHTGSSNTRSCHKNLYTWLYCPNDQETYQPPRHKPKSKRLEEKCLCVATH